MWAEKRFFTTRINFASHRVIGQDTLIFDEAKVSVS